ncbi:hypothetical protein PG997_001994 [Apiospora hydei]|uniref:Uncharacterized protein n=1 Tax=Apiospora hydei TaxID=1337664 RepID=A0ABR1X873_9PEZI
MRKVAGEEDSSTFDLLTNFVIINGSPQGLECTTCGAYISKRWSTIGASLIYQLSNAIDYLQLVGGEQAYTLGYPLVRHNPSLDGSSKTAESIHLSTTVDFGITKWTYDMRTKLETVEPPELQRLLHANSTCWLPMFESVVIAWQESDQARRELPGLEIPFDMMVHLASAENYHHVDGGTVLLGFFTALIPIRRHPDSNTIQWHFESIGNDELIQPSKLKSIQRDWYKTSNLSELASSKCVVGWFEKANIMLGTSSLVRANRFSWSNGIRSRHQTAHREGFEGGGQISFGLGPINLSPQAISSWRFHSNVQRYKAPDQYTQAIRLSAHKVATVIDTGSKQAWLIPMLSLVLHLCHRYFQEVKLVEELDDPIPFAEPSPDGSSAAIRALESEGDVVVLGKSGEPDCEFLRQLVLRINANLLDSSATREPPKRDIIYASELMDTVVQPANGSVLKEICASEDASSWKDLASKADVIGVCAGIGEVIQPILDPTKPVRPKCECLHLPRSLYLLAAHILVITNPPGQPEKSSSRLVERGKTRVLLAARDR